MKKAGLLALRISDDLSLYLFPFVFGTEPKSTDKLFLPLIGSDQREVVFIFTFIEEVGFSYDGFKFEFCGKFWCEISHSNFTRKSGDYETLIDSIDAMIV